MANTNSSSSNSSATVFRTPGPEQNLYPSDPSDVMEPGFHKYNKLCRALQMGDWEKAQGFLNEDDDVFTAELNSGGQRCLHVAIGNPKNTAVVTRLLERIDPNQLEYLVDKEQQNALHFAAVLGNTEAAKELVNKNRDLLGSKDKDGNLPVHKAICNSHEATFIYLLNEHLNDTTGRFNNPFDDQRGALLLCEIIMAGLLDVAYELLTRYPRLVNTVYSGIQSPLYCIATKWDVYLSSKHYNCFQRLFISRFDKYDPLCRALQKRDWEKARNFLKLQIHGFPTENSLHVVNQTPDTENQQTNRATTVTECTKSCINHVVEWITGKFWEVFLLHLPLIKDLQKYKVEHNIAVMILEFICEKVCELPSNHEEHYKDAYFKALENNTPEVVEQIMRTFPQSILMENSDRHMLSHLSIINRSEKIYSFFVHEVTHNKYLYIVATDKQGNNLLHLAGQLAPTHKLNKVTGAALQMQRELQWFEEVKKLIRPKEREDENNHNETPIMVFRKAHADLKKEGEVWTKKVADSYIITAALMITIVFAAIINVPGGIKGNTEKPTFHRMSCFMVFLVSDAISLFTATVSLIFFLSILTSRYAEEDFLYILPFKLMCGLVMLFISVTTMLIAFSATLLMMFVQETLNIMIIIGITTFVPILSFICLQLPLLVDLISSTYGRRIFRKRHELGITSI